MATKELLVALRLTVSDLSEDERKELAAGMEMEPGEVPGLDDTSAAVLSDLLEQHLAAEPIQNDIFEGSDEFVKFTACKVVSAEWQRDTIGAAD